MPGIADIALGTAPILGGAVLGVAAGQLRGPDFRSGIKADLDLLDRLPEDQEERRAGLQRIIDQRIDDLVAANTKSRQLRAAASSYQGNWRDIVLFIAALLFTVIWWNVNHHRSNWLLMFVVMIVVSIVTALYAFRGASRGLSQFLRRANPEPPATN